MRLVFVLIRSDYIFYIFTFSQKIQSQKPAKQISNSNLKNFGISRRKINATLDQPVFFFFFFFLFQFKGRIRILRPLSFEFSFAGSIEPNILSVYGLKFLERFVRAKKRS